MKRDCKRKQVQRSVVVHYHTEPLFLELCELSSALCFTIHIAVSRPTQKCPLIFFLITIFQSFPSLSLQGVRYSAQYQRRKKHETGLNHSNDPIMLLELVLCVSYFCITLIKVPDRSSLVQEKSILTHGF